MNDSSVHENQKPPEPIPVVNIASLSGKGAKFFVTAKSKDKTLTIRPQTEQRSLSGSQNLDHFS